MLFDILAPTGNSHGPLHTESLLRTMHRAIARRDAFSLRMSSVEGSVRLAADVSDDLRMLFLQQLQDAYPGTVVSPSQTNTRKDSFLHVRRLRLRPDILMIRTHDQFLDLNDDRHLGDPISGVLASLRTGGSGRVRCDVELRIWPARLRRVRAAERAFRRLQLGFNSMILRRWYLQASTSSHFVSRWLGMLIGAIARRGTLDGPAFNKPADQLFECMLRITVSAPPSAADVADRQLRSISAAFGRFTDSDTCFSATSSGTSRPFLLTPKELATLWHLPTESGDTVSRVKRPAFREIEPPVDLASRKKGVGDTTLGRTKFRQQQNQFGITADDLRRHMIAVGKTGCGKSTFLLNVVRQQIESGRGVVLIDPHGQLADEVLETVPKNRTNGVIVFDASDRENPIGFNPLIGPEGTDETLIADGVLTSFKNVFGFDDGSAPRMLHIFRNCLLSLIGTPHASLSSVQRILIDSNFRRTIVAQVDNKAVQSFWLTEFNRWNERDRTQYIASLQNKLGAFTTNDRLQRILHPERQGIHLREVMDKSRVLICNLSKGTFGHDSSTLLGSLLISSLQIAAMSRADVGESERPDCVIVIDEFHSYLSDGNSTMSDALAESRKYRTSYVLSTQMLEQLDSATLAGVLGNCGSTLCMTVGPRDAEILAELLACGLNPDDLMRIPKYHGYMRMLIDGAPHSFSMTTLPPPRYKPNRGNIVRKVSSQRFGQRRLSRNSSQSV